MLECRRNQYHTFCFALLISGSELSAGPSATNRSNVIQEWGACGKLDEQDTVKGGRRRRQKDMRSKDELEEPTQTSPALLTVLPLFRPPLLLPVPRGETPDSTCPLDEALPIDGGATPLSAFVCLPALVSSSPGTSISSGTELSGEDAALLALVLGLAALEGTLSSLLDDDDPSDVGSSTSSLSDDSGITTLNPLTPRCISALLGTGITTSGISRIGTGLGKGMLGGSTHPMVSTEGNGFSV
ncbi:hypothetical protein FB45DRAFT_131912 [Roridomyces roridus]|uniref:Uncharacterized protein n=1 Tax=Roridomyces roridus TaxID=1738132 RepID=A0AAD7FHL2_9AGAR|nr:hypothetical protein FB45DRAFT_131912 [Roridomyces roridus]